MLDLPIRTGPVAMARSRAAGQEDCLEERPLGGVLACLSAAFRNRSDGIYGIDFRAMQAYHHRVMDLARGTPVLASAVLWCAGLTQALYGQAERMGCGPPDEEHRVHRQKVRDPIRNPAPDKAGIYVIRPIIRVALLSVGTRTKGVFARQTKTGVDGKWVGVNLPGTYFYFEADPGIVRLCSTGLHPSVLLLSVKPGELYYVLERNAIGGEQELVAVTDDVGNKYLKRCQLSTFESKRPGSEER